MSRFPQGLLVLLFWVGAAQGLIRVPQDVDSLQSAIDLAMEGDTVLVAPGTWTERVHIPSGTLCLASNYIFSGDSTDIVNTVLDGQLEGTIISVEMDEASRLEINGLTFTGGMGSFIFETSDLIGGAIDIVTCGHVNLSNLVFFGNRAIGSGPPAVCYVNLVVPTPEAHFVLTNINCYSNISPSNNDHAITISNAMTVYANRLRISNQGSTVTTQYRLSACDSIIVSDAVFTGLDSLRQSPFYFSTRHNSGWPARYASFRDIYFCGNTVTGDMTYTFSTADFGETIARNIHFEDNYFPEGSLSLTFGYRGQVDADSLYIRDNRLDQSYNLFQLLAPGEVRNLIVTGNRTGRVEYFYTGNPDDHTHFERGNLYHALFENNTYIARQMEDIDLGVGGSMLYVGGEEADSMVLHNVQFLNNLYVDPDVYDESHMAEADFWGIGPNLGRLLFSGANYAYPPGALVLDSCVFVGNHQPNIMPDGVTAMLHTVGSSVEIRSASQTEQFNLYIRNCRMIDGDDGGFWIQNRGGITSIENLEIIDVGRFGLTCYAASDSDHAYSTLRNIYVKHVFRQEYYGSIPRENSLHHALFLGNLQPDQYDVSNVTLMDCDLPVLLRCSNNGPGFTMRNCLLDNNEADWFFHPLGQEAGFEYCLLPGSFPGAGNVWGVDPGFDPELEAPWLAADSPLIDAGDPDLGYNDLEDPLAPGVARWPSQGALRNDIGYTGGPAAKLTGVFWVGVHEKPEVGFRPVDISLGAPWPNPFNPVTRIPFTLMRPEVIKLSVHNLMGQEVAVLVNGLRMAGRQEVVLDGAGLASGLYFVTLEVGARRESRTITLLR
ncbi:MAG: hypothetical protein WC326_09000 [Candidatus Delongbacteria bacterium]